MRAALFSLMFLLGACEPGAPASRAGAVPSTLSRAEAKALEAKGQANAERQSKLTPRARRFEGDSLQP